jgi:TonB family protein
MPDREAPPLIRTRTTAAESAPLSEKLASKLSLDEAPAPAEKSFPDLSVPEVAPLDVPLVSVPSAARDERQVALSNSRYATYTGKVEKIIKRRWVVPSGFSLGGRKLTAVGVIRVSREGQILKVEIKRPSGHRLYDQSVLASMTGTIKLPPFPGDMKEDSLDVEITFRPDSR